MFGGHWDWPGTIGVDGEAVRRALEASEARRGRVEDLALEAELAELQLRRFRLELDAHLAARRRPLQHW